jgi:adenylate kinase
MVIFLGGAHGVGKSYLASRAAHNLALRHFTASQLIREQKGFQSWTDDRRVADAKANQELLVAAVRRLLLEPGDILLDGHFVLRGTSNALIRLDLDIFADLSISAILVLEAPDGLLAQRLTERTGCAPSLEDIAALTAAEREHAGHVASSLCVPFIRLQSAGEDEFEQALRKIMAGG